MIGGGLTVAQADAYLAVLGVRRRRPGREALAELVAAQVTRVPFENVSKLLRRRRDLRDVPDLDTYLDGIRRFNFGGTCYANAFHFCSLLCALGYDAGLCGAAMPSGEDVHVVATVALAGRDLLVDVGYGGPFLRPLPLDSRRAIAVRFGRDRFVLRPRDRDGRSRLDVYRDGTPIHGYRISPIRREAAHFRDAVQASFRDDATFMNAVMLVRYLRAGASTRSVGIYNLQLVRATPRGCTVEALAGQQALVAAIDREFGIPADLAREALAGVGLERDLYG